MSFKLVTEMVPQGDQVSAISKLVEGIEKGEKEQVLLGATGTGKTFTIAHVINKIQKKALILAHNKTLAMQLYQEMKSFFPENKVEYFVSYFDYYQPEAYKPFSNTYISKKSQRNDKIVAMRLKTLNSLINEESVIVVASVAAIYGVFNPNSYQESLIILQKGESLEFIFLLNSLERLGYKQANFDKLRQGNYFLLDNSFFLVLPWDEEYYFQIIFLDDIVFKIKKFKRESREELEEIYKLLITPQNYVSESGEKLQTILERINKELALTKENFYKEGNFAYAERLEKKVREDIFNIKEMGFCPGIENYSLYFDGRSPGETPYVLLDYFLPDYITFIDESHITVPQFKAMYNTDLKRKENLVKYGFRLPSAFDNRPLKQEEFFSKSSQIIFVSATPGRFELSRVKNKFIEQIIRPTGLLDPTVEIRKVKGEILSDIIEEIEKRIAVNEKVLIYALTIAMSEDISNFLKEKGVKVVYIHSKLEVFDRYQAITSLRRGIYDVIVGINLLKEGIDLPEVSLVIILDSDKAGFLRDTSSLIQIIGRSSRNVNGHVILYAENITKSMKEAINETERRRNKQIAYNKNFSIIPKTIKKPIEDIVINQETKLLIKQIKEGLIEKKNVPKILKKIRKDMKSASKEFRFDKAIALRNALLEIEEILKA